MTVASIGGGDQIATKAWANSVATDVNANTAAIVAHTAEFATLPSLYAPFYIQAPSFSLVLGSPINSGGYPPGWLLDGTAAEGVGTAFTLPTGWATLSIDAYWFNTTAGAGSVVWRSYIASFAVAATVTLPAAQSLVTTVAGGNGVLVKSTVVTGFAVGAVGNLLAFRLDRLPTDAGDTLAGDVSFLGVQVNRLT